MSKRRRSELEQPSDSLRWKRLMTELCVTHGYCGGPTHISALLPKEETLRSHQFAMLALEAEGETRSYDLKYFNKQKELIAELFEDFMGRNSVEAPLAREWEAVR